MLSWVFDRFNAPKMKKTHKNSDKSIVSTSTAQQQRQTTKATILIKYLVKRGIIFFLLWKLNLSLFAYSC